MTTSYPPGHKRRTTTTGCFTTRAAVGLVLSLRQSRGEEFLKDCSQHHHNDKVSFVLLWRYRLAVHCVPRLGRTLSRHKYVVNDRFKMDLWGIERAQPWRSPKWPIARLRCACLATTLSAWSRNVEHLLHEAGPLLESICDEAAWTGQVARKASAPTLLGSRADAHTASGRHRRARGLVLDSRCQVSSQRGRVSIATVTPPSRSRSPKPKRRHDAGTVPRSRSPDRLAADQGSRRAFREGTGATRLRTIGARQAPLVAPRGVQQRAGVPGSVGWAASPHFLALQAVA